MNGVRHAAWRVLTERRRKQGAAEPMGRRSRSAGTVRGDSAARRSQRPADTGPRKTEFDLQIVVDAEHGMRRTSGPPSGISGPARRVTDPTAGIRVIRVRDPNQRSLRRSTRSKIAGTLQVRTQTHRQTDADTQTHGHRHTDTQTHRPTDTQTHRHTDTRAHAHTRARARMQARTHNTVARGQESAFTRTNGVRHEDT